jgi:hypothetical protein
VTNTDKMGQMAPAGGDIHKRIVAIMRELPAILKDRKNTQQGYNFRGIDDVYNMVHPIMAKHGVFMTCEILTDASGERPSKSGGVLITRSLRLKYCFVADDGSCIATEVIGEGMDSGDKAANKALSVGQKYAILQAFMIPTDDAKDPEVDNPEPMPTPKPVAAVITKTAQNMGADLSPEAKDVRKKLGDLLLEMAHGDKEGAKYLLETYSAFTGKDGNEKKSSTLANMSEAWIKSTYGKAKKAHEEGVALEPESDLAFGDGEDLGGER